MGHPAKEAKGQNVRRPAHTIDTVKAPREPDSMAALRTLAGGMAHEVNNALGPIVGHADLMLLSLAEDSGQRDDAQAILDAAERVRELTAQIMLFCNRVSTAKRSLPLQDVLAQAVAGLSLPSGVQVKTHIEHDCPQVRAERQVMARVIDNLLKNAVQAVGASPGILALACEPCELSIAVEERDDPRTRHMAAGSYVRLSVADTGCGMPPEVIRQIFEPFYSTRARGEGLGMGLSVVYGVATGMGGHVLVQSEVGSGSRFEVYLPAQ